MQASKLKIGDVCAIKNDEGHLVAFEVGAVNTRRVGKHPSDFSHTVEGWYLDPGTHARQSKELTRGINPDKLLGLYTEYVELVEQQQLAKQRVKAENKRQREQADELVRLLYQMIGEPVPNDLSSYHNSIRAEYGHMVKIDNEGCEKLLAALKGRHLKVVA